MKFLFLLTQDLNSPSGLGRFFPLAKELTKLENQIKILTLHSDYFNLNNKKECKDNVEIIYLGQMQVQKIGSEKFYYKFTKFIFLMSTATIKFSLYALFGDYEVLFVGKPHPMNGIAGFLGKKLRHKKLIVDCDDLESSSNRFQNNWQRTIVSFFENKLPLYADIVVTNTYFTKERLLTIGVSEEKILILPNGIDRDRFKENDSVRREILKSELKIAGKKIVGYIGTLSVISHPIEILLEAIALLKTLIIDIHLIIVGGGEDIHYIRRKIMEFQIADIVTLVGRIEPDKISDYYQICDVTVDPVYKNDIAKARLPLKMFESWVVGVPFVTSDVGDRKLYLSNPLSGLTADGDSAIDLSTAIYQILSDEILKKYLIKNGLENSKRYYWDVISKNFLDAIIERIIQ